MKYFWFFAQALDSREINLPRAKANQETFDTAFRIFFVTLGAVAVLLFVIAGFRYVTSQGDPAKVAAAKSRLIYIGIGLIIIALAGAMVNFVIDRIG